MKKLLLILFATACFTACRDNSNPRSVNDNTEVTSQSDAENTPDAVPDTSMGYDTSGYYDNK